LHLKFEHKIEEQLHEGTFRDMSITVID